MSLGNDGGIPAVMNVTPTGTISSGSGGMGWGNDGSWWIIILFLFIFAGGWNRNGWGGNGNGATPSGSGAIDNYVLASDFAQVERKLDTVQQGFWLTSSSPARFPPTSPVTRGLDRLTAVALAPAAAKTKYINFSA